MSVPESILLMGGSFDPVHNGHLVIARDARERLGLARVVLVPAAQSPFKAAGHRSTAEQRLAMLRRAVRGEPRFTVSALELRRAGPSYTIDTVRHFRRRFPAARLVWLIGADNVAGLPRWREAAALVTECEIWVAARGGIESRAARRDLAALPAAFRSALRGRMLETRQMEVSSTEIRARAAASLSIKGLVPDAVASYISRVHLYR